MRFVVNCVATLLLAAIPVVAQEKEPPPEKTGLKVEEKAPAFKLKDQAGKERSLDEFLKTGKLAILFHRSAAW